jgi:hypothetical protein
MTFKCSNTNGAVLMLRAPAARVEFGRSPLVEQYAADNYSRWNDFARNGRVSRFYAVPEGGFVLVKGCDKTSSWAHAAFTESSKEASIVFDGEFVKGSGGFNVGLRGSWHQSVSAVVRESPPQPSSRISFYRNHTVLSYYSPANVYTVFARLYKFKRRSMGPLRPRFKISLSDRIGRSLKSSFRILEGVCIERVLLIIIC